MLHAFDPGLALGWACWQSNADKPFVRLLRLKAESEGAVYLRAREKLCEILQRGDEIAVEAPVLPRGPVSIRSRLVLFGIRSIIYMVAFERGAGIRDVEPSAWRHHYLGVTQAPRKLKLKPADRRKWIKDQAIAAAVRRGWGSVSADEADALGILDYLRAAVDQNYAATSTPLFQGAA
jgi:hypothetical protein